MRGRAGGTKLPPLVGFADDGGRDGLCGAAPPPALRAGVLPRIASERPRCAKSQGSGDSPPQPPWYLGRSELVCRKTMWTHHHLLGIGQLSRDDILHIL